jgi:hypothetical protein
MKTTLIGLAATALVSVAAFGQDGATAVQRDVNQQTRIEQGLKSGELNTREAARLERGEARVERMEARALSDGELSQTEKQRIRRQQNQLSKEIYREKHDAQTGDANSVSQKRMAADVQRNVNQQERIEQGIQSGELTGREVGQLERGQAHVNRLEGRAGANGFLGPREQRHIQRAENRQSKRIYRQKHDAQTRE